jgi:DinB superfamily
MRKFLLVMFISVISVCSFAQSSNAPAKPATPPANAPAQPPATMTVAQIMDRQLTNLEHELVPLVEAMPEDKFNYAPTGPGEFKGVRTFGLQAKHIAHTNFMIFAGLLGEKFPANVKPDEDNGPESMTAKADIVKYLKDSFEIGHRAMNSLTATNVTERITPNPFGGNGPGPFRLGAANLTLWHSFDHYGQMVEYLRSNGIVPPASRQQQQ